MQLKKYIRYAAIACLAILPVIAAEYRGQVKFSGLPLPGATITATQGDKKLSAVSDQQGIYDFPDLPDGTWQLEVDMMGFTHVKQDATPGSGLPGPTFELKMLPLDQIQAVTQAPAPVTAAPAITTTTNAAPAPAPTPSIVAANAKPANGKNGAPAAGPASAFQRTDLKSSGTPRPRRTCARP